MFQRRDMLLRFSRLFVDALVVWDLLPVTFTLRIHSNCTVLNIVTWVVNDAGMSMPAMLQ